MCSETRGGRHRSPRLTIEAAIGVAEKAIDFVSRDTLENYLDNTERQFAIERALIRYGEALKDLPPDVIASLDPAVDWDGPPPIPRSSISLVYGWPGSPRHMECGQDRAS